MRAVIVLLPQHAQAVDVLDILHALQHAVVRDHHAAQGSCLAAQAIVLMAIAATLPAQAVAKPAIS